MKGEYDQASIPMHTETKTYGSCKILWKELHFF